MSLSPKCRRAARPLAMISGGGGPGQPLALLSRNGYNGRGEEGRMAEEAVGLADLVAEARARLGDGEAVGYWHELEGTSEEGPGVLGPAVEIVAEAICEQADRGNHLKAGRPGHPWDAWIEAPEHALLWELSPDCPDWGEFLYACETAERIDCFLACLERGPGAPLARDCRRDLELLLVLADWYDENGRPLAAAEARHLYGLVQSLRAE
jgi:hypothetical protein